MLSSPPNYYSWGFRFSKGCNLILLVTEGCIHNFRTLGQPLLGENKVHPQMYHSAGKEGYQNLCRVQSYSFGNGGPNANFQNPSTAPSGKIGVRVLVVVVLHVITTQK